MDTESSIPINGGGDVHGYSIDRPRTGSRSCEADSCSPRDGGSKSADKRVHGLLCRRGQGQTAIRRIDTRVQNPRLDFSRIVFGNEGGLVHPVGFILLRPNEVPGHGGTDRQSSTDFLANGNRHGCADDHRRDLGLEHGEVSGRILGDDHRNPRVPISHRPLLARVIIGIGRVRTRVQLADRHGQIIGIRGQSNPRSSQFGLEEQLECIVSSDIGRIGGALRVGDGGSKIIFEHLRVSRVIQARREGIGGADGRQILGVGRRTGFGSNGDVSSGHQHTILHQCIGLGTDAISGLCPRAAHCKARILGKCGRHRGRDGDGMNGGMIGGR